MNKTYAVSDLHGHYGFWQQIKNYIDETDTIYFLGDAVDRGPDGIKLMKELLVDERVIYLLGNHEDIMGNEAPNFMEGRATWLWPMNGGETTMEGFSACSEGTQMWLLNKIYHLPRFAEYTNKSGQKIFMCHAGADPDEDEFQAAQHGIKDAYIWSRDHFWSAWPEEGYENTVIVHGHTPVPYLMKYLGTLKTLVDCDIDTWKPEIVRYCDNHKIDIDLGCFYLGRCALLDLDTLEPIYFEEEIVNEI